MSSNIAIKVEGLSKCYQIYDQPRDRLKQFVLPRLQRLVAQPPRQYYREFWALKDVSFEIKKGETVGIIGRNGSGKSTLLQMICGTLNPTSGSIQTNGRIAALLELGSGFNPEFTGRENVYMNAAVLGLERKEIEEKFDSIAAFADIGAFIDQPVKTYSSGMYVRLAFAISANIDPEILIVDEALAVGDSRFQTKCINRLNDLRESGSSILFVSHAIEQVKRFCDQAIWLHGGVVIDAGRAALVCDAYDNFMSGDLNSPVVLNSSDLFGASGKIVSIESVKTNQSMLRPFECFFVDVFYRVHEDAPGLLLGVAIIRKKDGVYVFGPNTHLENRVIRCCKGEFVIRYSIPELPLLSGEYWVDVGVFNNGGVVCLDYKAAVAEFKVITDYFSEGLVYIQHQWEEIR